ncbi:hypothetical protein SETIT_8G220600v2 [Setaria italica]|uniref:Uncharacterized protein n=1 Tax=Setaria italica TaxID=4555 RepID=A0A368SAJ3_SETIT|nr:hypothetical protein SETIT_8G220600v2 [Setaria italica]
MEARNLVLAPELHIEEEHQSAGKFGYGYGTKAKVGCPRCQPCPHRSSSGNLSYLYSIRFGVPRKQKWFLVPLVPSASGGLPVSCICSYTSPDQHGTLGYTLIGYM